MKEIDFSASPVTVKLGGEGWKVLCLLANRGREPCGGGGIGGVRGKDSKAGFVCLPAMCDEDAAALSAD